MSVTTQQQEKQLGTFRDASGKITIAVFERKSGDMQHNFIDFGVDVADDMVVIGGGAEAVCFPFGALLTASYPDSELSAWLASSKDHNVEQLHYLKAFSIGLKIEGISREELIEKYIHIARCESEIAQHPEVSASIPLDYVLLGGGFNINWQDLNPTGGNLATASYPENGFTWKVRSKDHNVISKASITAYAIGLKRKLPVGDIVSKITPAQSTNSQYPSATAEIPPGYVMTGGGGDVHWKQFGSLLWKLRPMQNTTNQDFTAAAKDHQIVEPASLTTYSLGIKLT